MVIAAAIAACACVGGAVVLLDDSGSEDRGTYYTVTYVLDGGTNSDKNPDGFYVGDDGTLCSPTREGYLFNGWSSSADHNDIVTEIDTSVEGNVTLYAWWVEIYDGQGFTMSYTGKYTTTGPFPRTATDSGELTYKYLYYDDELGFYYTRINTADGKTTTTSKWSSENDDSDYTTYYDGMVDVYSDCYGKTVKCEKYRLVSSDSTETQYIYNGWIPVKIDVQYRTMFYTYTATYALSSTFTVDVQDKYSVTVYDDVGISTTGSGTYDAVTDVTLTASASGDSEFAGWYDTEGNLLSSESTYTVSKILSDKIIYACNKKSPDYSDASAGTSYTLPVADGATSVSWTVTDGSGNSETVTDAGYTFPSIGEYTVTYSCKCGGSDYYGYYTVLVDGTVSKTYTWKYDADGNGTVGTNEVYTYTLDIRYSDYVYYTDYDCSRQSGTDDEDRLYVTSGDKYVKQLAEYFTEKTDGWSDYKRMSFVLAFTQYIEYVSDTESKGVEEYWKFPLETLYEQNGDCEDTSILFCAIASAMHYKSAMLLFYGHMAAGVELPDGTITENSKASEPFPEDGVSYYYCETTSTDYALGTAPSGYEYNGTYYRYGNMGDIIPVDAVPVSS